MKLMKVVTMKMLTEAKIKIKVFVLNYGAAARKVIL